MEGWWIDGRMIDRRKDELMDGWKEGRMDG